MRRKFSRIVLAAGLGLALAFTFSCSSGGGNPGYDSDTVSSSSGTSVSSSSVGGDSPKERRFYGEIGTVCVGYANLFSYPLDNMYFIADGTDNYVNMYSVCGDKAQSSIKGTQAEGVSWLNARNISAAMFNAINQELFIKGNSAFLGFYPAVDGYLRYLYIEELDDGKGLLKILAKEE